MAERNCRYDRRDSGQSKNRDQRRGLSTLIREITERTEITEHTENFLDFFRMFRYFRLFRNLSLFLLVLVCDVQGQTAAEKQYLLGVSLGQRGQYAEAVVAFREALRLKPGWAEAHLNLGLALQRERQLDEAIAEMRAAIQIKPD